MADSTSTLEELDMGNNRVASNVDDFSFAIYLLFSAAPNLTHLDLTGNRIGLANNDGDDEQWSKKNFADGIMLYEEDPPADHSESKDESGSEFRGGASRGSDEPSDDESSDDESS